MHEAIKEKKRIKLKFNEEKIFQWSSELIEAIEYLHSNRIIHRDLKPSYIYKKYIQEKKSEKET